MLAAVGSWRRSAIGVIFPAFDEPWLSVDDGPIGFTFRATPRQQHRRAFHGLVEGDAANLAALRAARRNRELILGHGSAYLSTAVV